MKNAFNKITTASQTEALCGLCQDKLLRHVSQSRLFWYCPSCRQEMVCEKEATEPAIATHLRQITEKRQRNKTSGQSQTVPVRAR